MNQFSIVPEVLLELPALEWLDLGGNCLEQLPEDIYRSASRLPASDPWPPDLVCPCRMEKVHTLWLQRNQLQTLPGGLSRMSRLDTLVLSSNRLQDIPPMMEDMVHLRSGASFLRLDHPPSITTGEPTSSSPSHHLSYIS